MKKNYKSTTIWMCLVMVLVLYSCKDYLDIKSNASQTTPQTLDDLQRLLDASQYMNHNTPAYGQVSADEHFLTSITFNGMNERNRLDYTWANFYHIWDNDWARGYIPVYHANLVLDRIEEIERTDKNRQEWDNIMGSALFYRAYQYLFLVWTYAHVYDERTADNNPGIVLRGSSDPTVPSTRASVKESYEHIIADLKEAVDRLALRQIHVMRPSRLAAYGALARTYLSMGDYQSAYLYADSVLQHHDVLMEFYNPDDVNPSATIPFKQFNKEIFFYSEMPSTQPTIHPTYSFIDTILYKEYQSGDLRKETFYRENTEGYPVFKGSYSANTALFSGLATDEMLLIRAECAARLGNRASALDDLNALLRSRWEQGSFLPLELNDTNTILSIILKERQKELVIRNLRWIDIKRLNRDGAGISLMRNINDELIVLEPNDKRFALPIPMDIIEVTGIPQNEY